MLILNARSPANKFIYFISDYYGCFLNTDGNLEIHKIQAIVATHIQGKDQKYVKS